MVRRIAFLSLPLMAWVVSCKTATQVTVVVRTNVPYVQGNGVAVWANGRGKPGAALAASTDPWLADGEIGDVVVIPGEAGNNSPLTVRVAMGLRGKPASECTDDGDAAGCIIARRKLSFVQHKQLRVPVVMYLACEGVKCDQDSTCSYLGTCVPAQVDPEACGSAEGCPLAGEPPFAPGAPEAGSLDQVATDTSATDTGSTDTGATDTGATDAGATDTGGTDTGPTDAGVVLGRRLTAGHQITCARLDQGGVKCWGANADAGQLGLGDKVDRGDTPGEMGANLPLVDLGASRTAVELSSFLQHTCARLDNGAVRCWGANESGQLGLGDKVDRGDTPGEMGPNLPVVDLGLGRTAAQVAPGSNYTCARLDNGAVKCWGTNGFAQLGLGDTQDRGGGPNQMGDNLPQVALGVGRTAVELAAGNTHTCARLDNGAVKCWGGNAFGQLGLGDTQDRGGGPNQMGDNLPQVVLGAGRTAVALVAGSSHTCARLDDGAVKCWGGNFSGQLGLGDTQTRGGGPNQMGDNLPQVALGVGRTAVELAAGGSHTCARLDNGAIKCWGWNTNGQLGLGDQQDRGGSPNQMGDNLPSVTLGIGRSAIELAGGGSHTCVRLDNGSVKCWGGNIYGQLGLGDNLDRGVAPNQMGDNLQLVQLQ